jgi:hypothetical protein
VYVGRGPVMGSSRTGEPPVPGDGTRDEDRCHSATGRSPTRRERVEIPVRRADLGRLGALVPGTRSRRAWRSAGGVRPVGFVGAEGVPAVCVGWLVTRPLGKAC